MDLSRLVLSLVVLSCLGASVPQSHGNGFGYIATSRAENFVSSFAAPVPGFMDRVAGFGECLVDTAPGFAPILLCAEEAVF